jgi:hypothetical protein
MSSTSYPKTFSLPQAPAETPRNPQVTNAKGKGQGIRGPLASVTKALHNPFLPGNQEDWESIPTGDRAGTESTGSQTTDTNTNTTAHPIIDAAAANIADNRTQGGLSEPNVHALNAFGSGSASQDGNTSGFPTSYVNVDEMSVSDMTASYHKAENKEPYSPVGGPQVPFEVSHMGPWAEEKISKLGKE